MGSSYPALKAKFRNQKDLTGYDEPSLMGLTAARAAYQYGRPWLSALKNHLNANRDFVRTYISEHFSKARLIEPEGTYLLWIDSAYGFTDHEVDDLIVNKAKVWLDRGTMFGPEGACYQRINIATPQSVLEEALHRIASVFEGEKNV